MNEKNYISDKDYNKCKNAVKGVIRIQFSRSDHYKEFLNLHKIHWVKGKRKRVSYKCAECSKLYSAKEINVDHIVPIGYGVYSDFVDAKEFYDLVYCDYSNLQILCKDGCHKKKSALEKAQKSFHNARW